MVISDALLNEMTLVAKEILDGSANIAFFFVLTNSAAAAITKAVGTPYFDGIPSRVQR